MNRKGIIAMIVVLGVIAIALLGLLTIGLTNGFSFPSLVRTGNLQPAFEQSAPADGINSVRVNLASMDVEVYATQEQSIRMVQYGAGSLGRDELVTFTNAGGTITISQPSLTYWFFRIRPYQVLRLYLPQSYAQDLSISTSSGNVTMMNAIAMQNLTLHLTSGELKSDYALSAKQLNLEVTSGNVKLDSVESASYQARSVSGNVIIPRLNGNGTVNITSGNIQIGSYVGSGTLHTTSGAITATLDSLTGNLSVTTTSGSIRLTAAPGVGFDLLASCVSGSVGGSLPMTVSNSGKAASAHSGASPAYQLNVQATSGSITINQAK
jgi:lia operon protein LiaG